MVRDDGSLGSLLWACLVEEVWLIEDVHLERFEGSENQNHRQRFEGQEDLF